jgi:excisionase family DNA binding protein
MAESGLLTVAETASLLRHKPSTIRAWILRRKIPYVKLSRRVFIRRSDAEALITASLVPARMEASKETKQQRKANGNADQNSQFLPQS